MSARSEVVGRLRAAAIHFLVTLFVAGLAAGLVFGLWFPTPFARMLGGLELFLLIVVCDVVLGPLISLVIFNRRKPRRELFRDYVLVGVVQLAALVYGLHAVSVSRPAFVVFAVDRFEVISAVELDSQDLREAIDPAWRRLSWTGPYWVWAERPQGTRERNDLMISGLAGKDLAYFPKYYRVLSSGKEQILSRAMPLNDLRERHTDAVPELDEVLSRIGQSDEQLRWLPAEHPRGFWTALVDAGTGEVRGWIPLDPY